VVQEQEQRVESTNDGILRFSTPTPSAGLLERITTHPLLCELPGLLVLGVTEQLHDTLLVRGESGDLADDRLDESLLLAVDCIRPYRGEVDNGERMDSAIRKSRNTGQQCHKSGLSVFLPSVKESRRNPESSPCHLCRQLTSKTLQAQAVDSADGDTETDPILTC
jgi:hypothetical protein